MVAKCVVLGTFRATLHNECSGPELFLCLRDGFCEGVIVTYNLLLVDNQIAVIITCDKLVLMLEIILKFFV